MIVLQNDDYCLQDGGDNYVRGYSGGRQLAWLEKDLAAARPLAATSTGVVVACTR